MLKNRNWTRSELIEAVFLYSNLSAGEIDKNNEEIIDLSERIERTPRAVEMKIRNFLKADNRRAGEINNEYGTNYATYDKEVVDDFYADPERLLKELESASTSAVSETSHQEGAEKRYWGKQRVDQKHFRGMMLDQYGSCCITGIGNKELLIAAHIIPWSQEKSERLNPQNGLMLNALHDKAFEVGLITIGSDYRVKNSSEIINTEIMFVRDFFNEFNNKKINLPNKNPPSINFLRWHQREVFRE